MTDRRSYDERRGEYRASKLGESRDPRDPQGFKDQPLLDEGTGEVAGVKPAWQTEFEHTIAPALDAPRRPVVTHGHSHLKGPR